MEDDKDDGVAMSTGLAQMRHTVADLLVSSANWQERDDGGQGVMIDDDGPEMQFASWLSLSLRDTRNAAQTPRSPVC